MTEAPWPPGGGEMGALIRAHDWAATPLGPIEGWPHVLKCGVELILPAGFPMIVLWGDALIQIYNDGYRAVMGNKHPAGLGRPTRESWPEVWRINAPIYERVRAGETLTFEDSLYPIARSGRLEDAWFTLSYSPLRDDAGAIAGVLVTLVETTGRMAAEEALREREERFRAFVTASSDVVYRMSPDWSQMWQLDGADFLADTAEADEDWRDKYILPADRERVEAAIRQAIGAKAVFELEHQVIRADGTPGWTSSRAVPILGADGEIVEWLGAAKDVTERKQAEAALEEMVGQFRSLFDATDEGVIVVEPAPARVDGLRDWRYLAINAKASAMFGKPDLTGQSVRESFPNDVEEALDILERVAESSEALRVEREWAAQGIVVEMFVTPIGAPAARRLMLVMRNVTERRRAHDALRASERRLQRVLETDAVAVLFFTTEGVLIGANDVFLRMTGYSRSKVEAGTMTWRDMTPPEYHAESQAQMDLFAETGRIGPYEKEYLRKDGSRSWLLFAGRDLGDGTIVEFGVDIDDRKRVESALRESEMRFREFGENSSDALWIVDIETMQLEYLSPAFERIWGESREAVMADVSRWAELVHPEDRALAAKAMPRLLAGHAFVAEYRIVRPDGGIRWIRDAGFPIMEGGVVRRGGGIAQDITGLKHAEGALQEREERQRLLLAELQHRVRNTLAVVRSIARRTADTSGSVEDLSAHLDGRLAAFSRVQAMVTRDVRAGVDLEGLIEGELIAHATREGMRLKIKGPEVILAPRAAETMSLAIHELATNAVKYGALSERDGRVSVTWARRQGEEGDRLELDWRESGLAEPLAEPEREGFGMELLRRSMPYDLGAETRIEFRPEGVAFHLSMAIPRLGEEPGETP